MDTKTTSLGIASSLLKRDNLFLSFFLVNLENLAPNLIIEIILG